MDELFPDEGTGLKPWQRSDEYPRELYQGSPPSEPVSTSEAAAASVRVSANTMRARALECIRAAGERGITDEEGVERSGMAANTWRPRRRELYLLGDIVSNGERLTRSGRKAKVWVPMLRKGQA